MAAEAKMLYALIIDAVIRLEHIETREVITVFWYGRTRHRSRRHEAAADSNIVLRRRQSYLCD